MKAIIPCFFVVLLFFNLPNDTTNIKKTTDTGKSNNVIVKPKVVKVVVDKQGYKSQEIALEQTRKQSQASLDKLDAILEKLNQSKK